MSTALFKAGSIVRLNKETQHQCPTYGDKKGVVRWQCEKASIGEQNVYNVTYGPDDDVYINERFLEDAA